MAADLKDMLKKVLASEGKKKFFFAFGSGKRKDKKGEGELAVRGSKPKKAEIEAALADAGDVFEGVCWLGNGPETGQTVYFLSKGKKLSKTIVTTMTKTAKTTAGTQYDFQMPSPEEEARAEKLGGVEGEQPPGIVPPAPAGGVVPPAPPVASAPPTPPQAAAPPAAAPPAPLAPPQSGAEVMKRLNAMAADIKAAMLGPNKARVQTLFVSVNGLIKSKDFIGAGKALDELGPLVAKSASAPAAAAAAVPPAPPQAAAPSPPAAPANDAALAAEWKRRMISIEPKVHEAQKTRAGEAKWMKMFMSAQDLGSEENFKEALAILDKLEGLLSAPPKSAGTTPPASGDGRKQPSIVQLQQSRRLWEATLKKVRADRDKLINNILNEFAEEDDQAIAREATEVIKSTLDEFNEKLIESLDRALNAEKPEDRACRNAEAGAIVKNYLDQLRNEPIFAELDVNPFVPVKLHESLTQSLTGLAGNLI